MIGKTVSHYRIVEKIGEGGMGIVYRAEDTKLRRTVALKFLRPQAFASEEHRDRFIREAQTAAALDHPNICAIYGIDEANEHLFISMPLVDGVNLKEKIREGPLGVDEAVGIAIQIARGLEAAHKHGIVHRDVKSANVIVTSGGTAKIMDFGLAKITGAREISKTTQGVGTAAYMSPEQGRGDKVDSRTDIWSLGVILYEMITGELPFRGEYDPAVVYSLLNEDPIPVTDLRPGTPPGIARVIELAMAKDRDDRYQAVSEMLTDLESPARAIHPAAGPRRSGSLKRSIGVLPFIDLSAEKDQDYFCDGMAEEIINALTKIDGLRVAARTSSFAFKGKSEDVRTIGRKLSVETVMEGSVRKVGSRIRVTGQLVNVSDGYHLWSGQFDRELEDVFAIQEEIAGSIVTALRVELSDRERRAIERAPTRDVVAYDYYLRGRKFFYQSNRTGIEFACEMFSKAIKKDGTYSLAYAGLADCHAYLSLYFGGADAEKQKADAASKTALDLDPDLAEAHASRGLALSAARRYLEAEREFETAIVLDPALFEAYYFYARLCFTQGKYEKAVEMYRRAGEVNPEDYQSPSLEAFTYRTMNRMQEAKAACARSLEVIERHVEFNPDDSRAIYLGATALIDLGQRDRAFEWIRRAEAIDPGDPYLIYGVACFYSRMDDADAAVGYFEKALAAGFAHKEWVLHDSDFDSIRDDPRFKSLVDGMN
jgi:TolB-like protein/tetratricopeptide (TPR) repeat protein/tRNA A-37 threonylcarbamoyl transferase component Bud32